MLPKNRHYLALLLIGAFLWFTCKPRKLVNEEINECDLFGNYYEKGTHYIRRDFLNDEGGIDYKKFFDSAFQKRSHCNPIEESNPMIENPFPRLDSR